MKRILRLEIIKRVLSANTHALADMDWDKSRPDRTSLRKSQRFPELDNRVCLIEQPSPCELSKSSPNGHRDCATRGGTNSMLIVMHAGGHG